MSPQRRSFLSSQSFSTLLEHTENRQGQKKPETCYLEADVQFGQADSVRHC